MPRIFTFNSPLGDSLMLKTLIGNEGMSSLFNFSVSLLSPDNSIPASALLGKSVTVEIECEDQSKRYLNAEVIHFWKHGEQERYTEYTAELAPWFWYATRTSDCKIFQHKTVVQIADEVLGDYPFPVKKRLHADYKEIGYCVQYNETDFEFLSRLFEQEGIYYFFEHGNGEHTLVLADFVSAHTPLPGHAQIRYAPADLVGMVGEECIRTWSVVEGVKTGRFVTDDYDFKKPSAKLQQTRNDPKNHSHADYEIYNWGHGYTDPGHGTHLTRVELETLQKNHAYARGQTAVRRMGPGYTFSLYQHTDGAQNIEYLVTNASYTFQENPYATSGAQGQHTDWRIDFTVQKTSEQFRSAKATACPIISGVQTAMVVGPKGKELWCDKYGRVKVQFPWDRYGKFDENSSCWIRCSNPWAGSNYGGVHIPRIGQEVLVEYINGEVNRPIITGRVYNAEQMPPWDLPANATQSGFLTRSTEKGGYGNANALRFEDKKGAEQVWIQAERNMDVHVEHDDSQTVDNNRSIKVGGTHTESIRKGMTVNVTEGKQDTTVKNDITIKTTDGEITLSSPKKITLAVGGSTITMTPSNITIVSPRVDINP